VTPSVPARHASHAGHGRGGWSDRYRLSDVTSSEWVKLTSLRSTRMALVAFPVTAVVLGAVIAATTGAHWPSTSAAARARWDPTNNLLAGLVPGYLIVPVLGLLTITSEHGHGTFRSALTAVPDRVRLVVAKAIVVALTAFALCEAATFATFAVSRPLLGSSPRPGLGDPGVLRALVASGAYLALLGLFGLGLGALLRHSGAAVATYAAVAVVGPVLLHALPGNLARFGPIVILANSVTATNAQPEFLSPSAGMAVMAVYATVALAAGIVVTVRRDC
jgi:hypothetical protein